MSRKPRKGEVVCTCKRYGFPHRLMSGNCTGRWVVVEYFDKHQYPHCFKCTLYDVQEASCQVLEGAEPSWECPALQEFLDYNEVPVPTKLNRKHWG